MRVLVTDPLIAGYLDDPSWEVVTGRPEAEVVARLRLLLVPGAGLDRIALDVLGPGVTVCNTFHHGRSRHQAGGDGVVVGKTASSLRVDKSVLGRGRIV